MGVVTSRLRSRSNRLSDQEHLLAIRDEGSTAISKTVYAAAADGGLLFIAILIVILGGVIYGFYTVGGSGIEHHPHDGSDGAPGAKGQSEASGQDQGEGSALDDHGTE